MPTAGDKITVPTTPGARIATSIETSDSDNFTNAAEVVIMAVTANLIAGRVYRVVADTGWSSDTSGDRIRCRIRVADDDEDLTGAVLREHNVLASVASGTPWPWHAAALFECTQSGDQTFVVTGERLTGAGGNCRLEASSTSPSYLYVEYVEDA